MISPLPPASIRPSTGPSSLPFLGEQGAATEPTVTLLPIPFERTTSYGQGTQHGPAAILAASQYVELWDEELGSEPAEIGIYTADPWRVDDEIPTTEALEALESWAGERYRRAGPLVVGIGGEHSITAPLVRAARRVEPGLGVVQFDAHADLRDTYEGTPCSHACVMRRLAEDDVPALAVGIRSLSRAEAELIEEEQFDVLWAHELPASSIESFRARLSSLPEAVYLTFDVDYFDPALVPATGTPEPGGGTWYPTLAMLRTLFETKRVVGMDVVELAPIPHHSASDFLVAKLIYKCIGYWAASQPTR